MSLVLYLSFVLSSHLIRSWNENDLICFFNLFGSATDNCDLLGRWISMFRIFISRTCVSYLESVFRNMDNANKSFHALRKKIKIPIMSYFLAMKMHIITYLFMPRTSIVKKLMPGISILSTIFNIAWILNQRATYYL